MHKVLDIISELVNEFVLSDADFASFCRSLHHGRAGNVKAKDDCLSLLSIGHIAFGDRTYSILYQIYTVDAFD
jgi:hypothetical protein